MNIVFRVDSSFLIGSGHLIRCLTLADSLRDEATRIKFICRDHDGEMSHLVRQRGYDLDLLPRVRGKTDPETDLAHSAWLGVSLEEDACQTLESLLPTEPIDWLIVDHYAINNTWEEKLRPVAGNILVIDDLADRQHDCDILLDQNLNAGLETRYKNLVPEDCRLLCGPRYSLLRPQFLTSECQDRKREGSISHLLVFFGGVDATGETMKTCRAIVSPDTRHVTADVIAGDSNPQQKQIEEFCADHPRLRFLARIDNMAELMAKADLALGAGGTTTWERAWLGLPTIIITVAKNQIEGARAMADHGAAWYLGPHDEVNQGDIEAALCHALGHPPEVARMAAAAQSLFGDHRRSGTDLVVNAMTECQHAPA